MLDTVLSILYVLIHLTLIMISMRSLLLSPPSPLWANWSTERLTDMVTLLIFWQIPEPKQAGFQVSTLKHDVLLPLYTLPAGERAGFTPGCWHSGDPWERKLGKLQYRKYTFALNVPFSSWCCPLALSWAWCLWFPKPLWENKSTVLVEGSGSWCRQVGSPGSIGWTGELETQLNTDFQFFVFQILALLYLLPKAELLGDYSRKIGSFLVEITTWFSSNFTLSDSAKSVLYLHLPIF